MGRVGLIMWLFWVFRLPCPSTRPRGLGHFYLRKREQAAGGGGGGKDGVGGVGGGGQGMKEKKASQKQKLTSHHGDITVPLLPLSLPDLLLQLSAALHTNKIINSNKYLVISFFSF